MQAALGCRVVEARQFVLGALSLGTDRLSLLACGFNRPGQLGAPGVQAAQRKRGFLGLALQAALLLTAFIELAFGVHHPLIELGVALLGVGELHVELFKARFQRHPALLEFIQLLIHLGQVAGNLGAAHTGLLGQLRQAQGFDLQLVGTALALGGLAARGHQALRGIGISRLGPHQSRARFLGNQGLGFELFLQVVDFLGAGQQTGLLRVRRVKRHAMDANTMPRLHKNHLARLQRLAACQRIFKTGRCKTALQPAHQNRFLASVVEAQQIGQTRE